MKDARLQLSNERRKVFIKREPVKAFPIGMIQDSSSVSKLNFGNNRDQTPAYPDSNVNLPNLGAEPSFHPSLKPRGQNSGLGDKVYKSRSIKKED